jgi:CubicO group peptidase (beta-lactamase class C family)
MTTTSQVHGSVAPGFEAARQAFAANFARDDDYREVGAAFAAFHKGRCVVDLWGGYRDRARTRLWTSDTLVNVWSSTKGMTATAVAILVDRGLLDYDDKVSRHWPEFAANGKENISVAQLMSHQSGLNGFVEPTTPEDQFDWESCAENWRARNRSGPLAPHLPIMQ